MYVVKKVKDVESKNISCGIMRDLTNVKDFHGMSIIHVIIKEPTKKHYHTKQTEVYYILKGSIDLEVEGKTEHLKEKEMMIIFPETEHKAWKTSEEDAEILVICCPPWAEDDEVLVK